MKWWRNDDPKDDKNELEIKIIFAIPIVIMMGVLAVTMLTFTGCTHKMEHFKCECDCDDDNGSHFECGEVETKIKVEGR